MKTNKTVESHVESIAELIADGDHLETGQIVSSSDNTEMGDALSRLNRLSRSFRNTQVQDTTRQISTGDQWGHLQITSLIGEGGMGRVFRAHDQSLDSDVAVKFLSDSASEYIPSHSFIDEARRMARVRHPNVLAVFGAAIHEDLAGFWSECLHGQTLHEYLSSHRPEQAEVLSIAEDLASALNAVHKAGLIHADVKPLNVMIEPERGAVLMDFGAGVDLNQDSRLRYGQQATPAIMAPELFDGETIDTPCDIFALGILFYNLSTGRSPFEGPSLDELSVQVRHPERIDYSGMTGNRRWQRLVASMLEVRPSDRPDIDLVLETVSELREAPLKRARKVAVASFMSLIIAVALSSSYAWITTRIEQQKTQAALEESLEYNALLNEIVTSASPVSRGKDTLMLDVISAAEERLMQQSQIRKTLRLQALHSIAWTYKVLDDPQRALQTAERILDHEPDPQTEFDVRLLMAQQMLSQSDADATSEQLVILGSLNDQFDIAPSVEREYWVTQSDFQQDYGTTVLAEQSMDKARELITQQGLTQSARMLISQAHLLSRTSQFDAAVDLLQSALVTLREECDCTININTLKLRSEIAINRLNLGEVSVAQDELKTLLRDASEFLGETHVFTEDLYMNYTASLNESGDYKTLIDVITPKLLDFRNRYGTGSVRYQNAQNNLANAHLYRGEYDRAESLYINIISEMTALNGEGDFNVLLASYNLSELYYKAGRPSEARQLAIETLPRAESVLGKDHLITLELRDAAAWSLVLMGESEQAVTELGNLLKHKQSVLGKEHPYTLSTQAHLDQAQEGL